MTHAESRLNLGRQVKAILQHVGPLPREASAPLAHYNKSAGAIEALLLYFERKVRSQRHVPATFDKHRSLLYGMALVNLVENFERFIKELAAVCVDHVAPYVLDRRFGEFQIRGNELAAHFSGGSLGKSLCESDTRFRPSPSRTAAASLATPF